MIHILRMVVLIGCVGLLSACANRFGATVSRFHELPTPAGQTVVIVPSDPAKNASLEFATYANVVGRYLAEQGYRPARGGKADLIVTLDYSIDDGTTVIKDYGYGFGYGYGSFYPYGHYGPYYSRFGAFGYYDPFYPFPHSYARDIRTYITYARTLTLSIRPDQAGARNLFEATVESRGRGRNMPTLIPHMIQALFTDFPGKTGTVDRVVITLDSDQK